MRVPLLALGALLLATGALLLLLRRQYLAS
jgi:hypothetical protein